MACRMNKYPYTYKVTPPNNVVGEANTVYDRYSKASNDGRRGYRAAREGRAPSERLIKDAHVVLAYYALGAEEDGAR